jgi:predicted tellurium resistance membrane protein TerC
VPGGACDSGSCLGLASIDPGALRIVVIAPKGLYPHSIMEWLADPNAWIGLLTLTLLELVLGIDNIVFISILAAKLPVKEQKNARRIGLALAMLMRILLLLSISWVVGLTRPLFTVFGLDVTGRALILIAGGLFLLTKSTHEIHDSIEGEEEHGQRAVARSLLAVLIQIVLLDVVFSLDSVITAVGMVDEVAVMIIAVMLAVSAMMVFAGPLGAFVHRHPTIKMLALSFLLLIGVNLIAEGVGFHIPKGYTYFAMGFAVFVEMLNLKMRARKPQEPASRSRRLQKAIHRV